MLRMLLILLLESLGFNEQETHQSDLRKKELKQIHIKHKPLFILIILIMLIFFLEFAFMVQGTESGMVRNNLQNI